MAGRSGAHVERKTSSRSKSASGPRPETGPRPATFKDAAESSQPFVENKRKSISPTYLSLDPRVYEVLYAESDIAQRMVDLPVDEAMRVPVAFLNKDEEKKRILARYGIWSEVAKAWKNARISGTELLFLNVTDGQPLDKPFNPDKQFTFQGVARIQRTLVTPQKDNIIQDITNPAFGMPEFYRLNTTTKVNESGLIHSSRLIRFEGNVYPDNIFRSEGYWNQSILAPVKEVIEDYEACHDEIKDIIDDAMHMIYKSKNLKNLYGKGNSTEDYTKYLKTRVSEISNKRRRRGTWIVDKDDEDVVMLSASLQGIADLLDRSKRRLQQSTRIPAPLLFNESPGSAMSVNGSSEQAQWYDYLSSMRTDYLMPRLNRIFDVLTKASNIPEKDWDGYSFPSFYHPTDSEIWDIEVKRSQVSQTLISSQIAEPEEIRKFYQDQPTWKRFLED